MCVYVCVIYRKDVAVAGVGQLAPKLTQTGALGQRHHDLGKRTFSEALSIVTLCDKCTGSDFSEFFLGQRHHHLDAQLGVVAGFKA